LKRHTKKDPRYLLRTFPKAARLKTIEEYPEAVAGVLKELGLEDKDLYLKLPEPAKYNETWVDKINDYIPAFGCMIAIIFIAVCLMVGFFVVIKWFYKMV
jgi:hypothetical protein